VITAGEDFRFIDSTPREQLSPATVKPMSTLARSVDAQQLAAGIFAEDAVALGRRVTAALALRADYWGNRNASSTQKLANGASSTTPIGDRGGWEASPRLGLVVRPTSWLALRAAAYRSFRAPTINELYRPFQVGTIITAPNSALTPESLWGGELGVDASVRRLSLRATGFANTLQNPITNVTLDKPLADGAQRQRQNLGSALVAGVELAARWTPARRWRLEAAYTFVDATVRTAPAQPQLVGKRLAQDPRHRIAASVTFTERRWFEATAELRYTGFAYDDDLNKFGLPGYAVVNVRVARRIAPHLDAFVAVENLLNQSYLVGRSGVDTVGEPIFAYGGIRYRAARD
jgi:outer membrane receptor protein involved in Fe transport